MSQIKSESSIIFDVPDSVYIIEPDKILKHDLHGNPRQCNACDFVFEKDNVSILLEILEIKDYFASARPSRG